MADPTFPTVAVTPTLPAFASGTVPTSSALTAAIGSTSTPAGSVTGTVVPTNTEFRIRLGYLDNYVPTASSSSTQAAVATAQTSTASTNAAAQYTGILSPLAATGGLRFPYTPSISNSAEADYASLTMVHANTDYHAYSHTPNVSIGISGKFTVQNFQEGQYALAAIHFLRTVSKMYFGQNDAQNNLAGTPPPILQLNGYGTYMYNKLRVYVKSSSWNYEEGVDTVNIKLDSNYYVRLPVLFTLSVNLVVQNTVRAQRKDFSLDDYKSGKLMQSPPNNSGWI